MKSKGYFINAHSKTFAYESGLEGKFENFLKAFDFSAYIAKDEVVPIKMHLDIERGMDNSRLENPKN